MANDFVLIHTYSRADALADGVLVDASPLSRQAGFKVPVALTCAAWQRCVLMPPGTEGTQDANGRLWDVLWMCRYGIQGANLAASEFQFALSVVTAAERSELVTLKAVIGPDDDGRPCLTIMLPEED